MITRAARPPAGRELPSSGAFDPSNPPDPHEALKLVAKIAALLGVDDTNDQNGIKEALEHLFVAIRGDAASNIQARRQLSASERRAVDATGCDPRDFIAAKAVFSVK